MGLYDEGLGKTKPAEREVKGEATRTANVLERVARANNTWGQWMPRLILGGAAIGGLLWGASFLNKTPLIEAPKEPEPDDE